MEKLNAREIAQVKRIYQLNEADYNKMAKLNSKIAELKQQVADLQNNVDFTEERIKALTGGYTSDQLIKVVVTPLVNEDGTPKLDKSGYQLKKKQYNFVEPAVEVVTPAE